MEEIPSEYLLKKLTAAASHHFVVCSVEPTTAPIQLICHHVETMAAMKKLIK
jgi:hypothetical protein